MTFLLHYEAGARAPPGWSGFVGYRTDDDDYQLVLGCPSLHCIRLHFGVSVHRCWSESMHDIHQMAPVADDGSYDLSDQPWCCYPDVRLQYFLTGHAASE